MESKDERQLKRLQKRQVELEKTHGDLVAKIDALKNGLVWAVIEGVDTRKTEEELAMLERRLQAVQAGLPEISERIRNCQEGIFKANQQETQKELEKYDVRCHQAFREGLQCLSETIDAFDRFYQVYGEGAKLAGSVRLSFAPSNNLVSIYNHWRQALEPFVKNLQRNKPELVAGVDFSRFQPVAPGARLEVSFPDTREYYDHARRDPLSGFTYQYPNPIMGSPVST